MGGVPRWDALYRARAEEVSDARPTLTGDVFTGVKLPGRTGTVKARTVAVLQHPCSMRTDGVEISWQVLVAEVKSRREIPEANWGTGFFNLMPLPDLMPGEATRTRHQAADFDNLYTVTPSLLTSRTACLSPFGVNILLQRWVHYSSRVVVPTHDFQSVTQAFYEEADLIEEWCDDAPGDLRTETEACVRWLRADRGDGTYQERLKDPQAHSMVRRAMRAELKTRRSSPN
ncbi:MAG: hypothetical protein LBJ02_07350 [Bifidobacteriaceae bacterium]|nr:hypothetical protein [Bifidobacteriaceae bacterium]